MKKIFIELLGWYGVLAIMAAFALVSFKVISSSDFGYFALNLSGAAGIAVVSFAKKAWQPAILNILWALISIVAESILLFNN